VIGRNCARGGQFDDETGLKCVFDSLGTINSYLLEEWGRTSLCNMNYSDRSPAGTLSVVTKGAPVLFLTRAAEDPTKQIDLVTTN
jgi:hypothetical protein